MNTQIGFPGSYRKHCTFLLKEILTSRIRQQATQLAQGATVEHYRELLLWEEAPAQEFWDVYRHALYVSAERLAQHAVSLAIGIASRVPADSQCVLVSLARAGTPFGVLLANYLEWAGVDVHHYSVSLIKGPGIDHVALDHIMGRHPRAEIFFIDGWTGKGGISVELARSMKIYNETRGVQLPTALCVITDLAGMSEMAASTGDYMIPSAPIDAPMNGLVSRTILNADDIAPGDMHGAMIYRHLESCDQSNQFIETILRHMVGKSPRPLISPQERETALALTGFSLAELQRLLRLDSPVRIRHGYCETVRALHRGAMKEILLKNAGAHADSALLALARSKNVPVRCMPSLRYECVGITGE